MNPDEIKRRYGIPTGLPPGISQTPGGGWGPTGGPVSPFAMQRPMMPGGIPSVGGGGPPVMPQQNQMGGWGDTLKSVGKGAADYGPLILSALAAFEGYQQNRKADQLTKRAIQAEEEKARMVSEGRERRKNIAPPQLGETYTDEGNVYARKRRGIPSVSGY